MSTWKNVGANAHCVRWLLSASLLAAVGLTGPVAHAQVEDDGALDQAAPEDEVMADEPMADEAPIEAPAPDPAATEEMPASYSEWFNKMVENSHKPFEYHGYFRSGFGFNSELGYQEAFRAPDAPMKYRLGNETETYGELVFINNWLNPERDKDEAWFKTQVLLTFVAQPAHNFDPYTFTIREAFAQAGNVIKSKPDLKFWAGQRYYRRHDIHINDYYFYSESGYGGGVEDIDVGFGKMAIAYFGVSDPEGADVTEHGRVVENNVEFRVYDFELPGGTGVAALKGSFLRGQPDFENEPGFELTLMHIAGGFMGGYNKASIQLGYGSSADTDAPLFYHTPGVLKDTMRLLITESAQIKLSDKVMAMGAALVRMDMNSEADTTDTWISAGFRPIYHFTKYAAIAGEVGLDQTMGDTYADGTLLKFTVAPQIRAGDGFWARPTIRAYATAAYWTEEFEGGVAPEAYGDTSFGMAFGVQAESWW